MTQSYSELKSHIEQLWKIIEQQDTQIQELKKTRNSLCNERDDLQEKLRLVLSRETATPSTTSTLEKQMARDHDNTESTDVNEASSPGTNSPILPARSPYRSFNASDADVSTYKDRKHQLSSTSSLSVSPVTTKIITAATPIFATSIMNDSTDDINAAAMASQEPISPKIIQQDAKLFAQYQSAVLRRDMTTNNIDNTPFNTPPGQRQHPTASSPIVLVPSKSSTLPCQSHEYRLAQRKQHNSMVFPSSTFIPISGRKKKDDQPPPPTPPPHHYQQPRRQPTTNMTTTLCQQKQQKQKQHNEDTQDHSIYSPSEVSPSSTMKLNSISDVTVKVIGSLLKSNEKGKDVVSFILSVGKYTGDRFEELWRVQKLYSDFLDLDLKLKAQLNGSKMIKMTRLPEKQLFTTRSPNKLDQRRVALEKYLRHVITLPMENISDFCEFLSTNVVDHSSYMNQGNKEGYLTKRGKNFGGWKTRYFVLKKNRLEYYEAKDGSKLGSILLGDAQIGRQTPPSNSGTPDDNSESVYRHAILILEYRRTSIGNYVRHILCASSDTDCDEWITALLQAIQTNSEANNNESTPSSTISSLARSNSTINSKDKQRNKKQQPSDKQRKLFKGEIRTVAATPISHLRVDSSQAVDMDKLTLVPVNNDIVTSPSTVNPTPSGSSDSGNGTMSSSTTTTPSNSLPLSSPLSMSSLDSPCTLRQQFHYNSFGTSPDKGNSMIGLNYQQQQYQHRPSLTKTDSLEDNGVSPQSRSNSPIPTALFDRRESDDSIINGNTGGGSGGGNEQQQDKKMKTKSANRMTLWGKKVFGNQQRSLSSPISPNVSGTEGLTTIAATISSSTSPNTIAGNPTPPSSSSSSSSSTSQQQQQQQDQQNRGSTSKSLRHVLSRPSKHQQQMETGPVDDNISTTLPTNDSKLTKQFMPSLSKSSPSTSNNSKQVFGVPLEEAVRVSRVSDGYPLPAVVFRCIEYLDAKNAILEEGLYRLSGSNATLQKLKKKFNQDGDVPLLNAKEEYDVHVVAGLLKMWLRELPITVLTRELRPEFIQVIDLLERKDRVNELGRLVSELPLANYTLLRILTSHLIRVVKHSDINLMTVRNIGIVFSPTLGIPGTIFNLFLSEFDYIFWTTKDGDAAPRRLEEEGDGGDDMGNNDAFDNGDDAKTGVDDGKDIDSDDNDGGNDETGLENEHNNDGTARRVSLLTENQVDSVQHQLSFSSDQQQYKVEPLAPISSVVVPRRVNKKLVVHKNQGRSNRNSILYIDAAPIAIVDLEKHTTGGTNVAEDEEEIDELALDVAMDDDMP